MTNPATEAGKAFERVRKLRTQREEKIEEAKSRETARYEKKIGAVVGSLSPEARAIYEGMV